MRRELATLGVTALFGQDLGEYCEYVTTSEPKLVSASAHVDGMDPAGFKAIAPKDQDCLDMVAFAATLKSTP